MFKASSNMNPHVHFEMANENTTWLPLDKPDWLVQGALPLWTSKSTFKWVAVIENENTTQSPLDSPHWKVQGALSLWTSKPTWKWMAVIGE